MKLLVLCTGNSCRSQMAEGFLKSFATELKIEIEVFSAGVQTDGLNPRAVIVMSEIGIDISKQTSDLAEKYLDTGITHLFSVCEDR
ncbi:MAG: arsenate reductase ArsC, partial [Crocinitomicaceae bacterium]|nr:arsenate reductase ArsC [Crocinitomicaceae bacterium]